MQTMTRRFAQGRARGWRSATPMIASLAQAIAERVMKRMRGFGMWSRRSATIGVAMRSL